jgi:hypothetical protein
MHIAVTFMYLVKEEVKIVRAAGYCCTHFARFRICASADLNGRRHVFVLVHRTCSVSEQKIELLCIVFAKRLVYIGTDKQI